MTYVVYRGWRANGFSYIQTVYSIQSCLLVLLSRSSDRRYSLMRETLMGSLISYLQCCRDPVGASRWKVRPTFGWAHSTEEWVRPTPKSRVAHARSTTTSPLLDRWVPIQVLAGLHSCGLMRCSREERAVVDDGEWGGPTRGALHTEHSPVTLSTNENRRPTPQQPSPSPRP